MATKKSIPPQKKSTPHAACGAVRGWWMRENRSRMMSKPLYVVERPELGGDGGADGQPEAVVEAGGAGDRRREHRGASAGLRRRAEGAVAGVVAGGTSE